MGHELVIRGGTVVDGTGAAARTADVAVDGGRITEVGRVDGAGRREIDADGALVTPGFVDIHTHYDGQATWDDRLQPSSLHGVTTVVMGNCGVGFAPVHDADHQRLVQLMEGVEDIPGVALDEGLPWNWNDLPSFLDALDRPHDIDFAAQVPHAALRLHVMGDRGANRDPANEDDIEAMARLAAAGIEAGFLGFTTSRTLNHRTSTGDPTPTLTAARNELVGIAEAIGRTGTGVLQMVGDFVDLDEEFGHLEAMMAASGRPLSFSLAQSPRHPRQWRELLDRLELANAAGHTMRAQVAPRPVGILLGEDCTISVFRHADGYREIASLPLDERVTQMRERRDRIVAEAEQPSARRFAWDNLFPMGDAPDYEPSADHSVAAIAARENRPAAAVAFDHALTDGGTALFYTPFLNYADGNLDATGEMIAHPFTVPGLADGGAHVGTICDASFPTFLLTHWGRDRDRGRLPVEELVKQHCRDTAETVGLFDRGVLAPGMRADINVIDFDELGIEKPRMQHDLPAGGRRVMQDATGYLHTIVAGEETYRNGEATEALPGRLVRGAQHA